MTSDNTITPLLITFTIILFSFSTCRASIPNRLFYKPKEAKTYIYKTKPKKLKITAYPRPAGVILGTVIFIHGGGWQAGGSDLPVYADWHYPLRDARIMAYSIEHRTAPFYKGHQILSDCIEAIKFIERLNHSTGIGSNKIAVVGYSSGGHLAILSALKMSKSRIQSQIKSVVAYYAPLDLTNLVYYKDNRLLNLYKSYIPDDLQAQKRIDHNSIKDVKQSLRFHSPIDQIHKNMPKILLIHGKKDKLVPYTQSVNFAMQSERIVPGRVSLIIVQRADHNFVRSRNKWARKIDKTALHFIENSFK